MLSIKFFDYDFYKEIINKKEYTLNSKISLEIIKTFLKSYENSNFINYEFENDWFNNIKDVAKRIGFCVDNKLYKEHPLDYVGNVNDACELLRICLTGRNVTPNLFSIMKILKQNEIKNRINYFVNLLK